MAAAASLHHPSHVAPPLFVVGGGSQTGLERLLLSLPEKKQLFDKSTGEEEFCLVMVARNYKHCSCRPLALLR